LDQVVQHVEMFSEQFHGPSVCYNNSQQHTYNIFIVPRQT
jgi:hypothetical protein